MKRRCTNKNYIQFKDYGGRGITICKRWLKFANFLEDMGERPTGKTLDRINTNKNYSPTNCKWSTPSEQSRNKRKGTQYNRQYLIDKKPMFASHAIKVLAIHPQTFYSRVKRGIYKII